MTVPSRLRVFICAFLLITSANVVSHGAAAKEGPARQDGPRACPVQQVPDTWTGERIQAAAQHIEGSVVTWETVRRTIGSFQPAKARETLLFLQCDSLEAIKVGEALLRFASLPSVAKNVAAIKASLAEIQAQLAARTMPAPAIPAGPPVPPTLADAAKTYTVGHDAYTRKDYAAARSHFERAATSEHPDALFYLGYMAMNGLGEPKNPVRAVSFYRRAAARGNLAAMNNLGSAYTDGAGVARDPVAAATWHRRAAEGGNVTAMLNYAEALKSGRGVTKDLRQAAGWFRNAAEKENAEAMNLLGIAYHRGEGVDRDYAAAATWYEKAWSKGITAAAYNLGILHESGSGAPASLDAARDWFEKAAARGHEAAKQKLAAYGTRPGPAAPAAPGPSSSRAAVISGRVTNAAGQAESAVLVRIESLNVGASTGRDGTYRLVIPNARIKPGQIVHLRASRAGLEESVQTMTLSPSASLGADFVMAVYALRPRSTAPVEGSIHRDWKPRRIGSLTIDVPGDFQNFAAGDAAPPASAGGTTLDTLRPADELSYASADSEREGAWVPSLSVDVRRYPLRSGAQFDLRALAERAGAPADGFTIEPTRIAGLPAVVTRRRIDSDGALMIDEEAFFQSASSLWHVTISYTEGPGQISVAGRVAAILGSIRMAR